MILKSVTLNLDFPAHVDFKPCMTPIDSSRAQTRLFAPYEAVVFSSRAMAEAGRGSLKPQLNPNLNKIWWPGFRRPLCAKLYYNGASADVISYGATLFPGRANATEALFGLMGYHVEREVVLSFGNRLSELGEQTVFTADGRPVAVPMNLQEKPSGDVGEQALILSSVSGLDTGVLEAALIRAIDVPDAVKVVKSVPDAKRRQSVHAEFAIPAAISWDGRDHRVVLNFTVKLPRDGRKDFQSWLMGAIHLVNGRPAQHYQDQAAAVIDLQETLFADKNSVSLVVDPGTPGEFAAAPDAFLGKPVAMLLSQSAGGFFERAYLQTFVAGGVTVNQKTPDGSARSPEIAVSFQDGENGMTRVTDLGYAALATSSRYVEKEVALDDGRLVYELTGLSVREKDGGDILNVDFNAGDGRGIRDLGTFSERLQTGRFKMSVEGKNGYAYGDFTVSPTMFRGVDGEGSPVYETSVILTPKFSRDMARKKIILHVVQTAQGVYSETQVVPESFVYAPPSSFPR